MQTILLAAGLSSRMGVQKLLLPQPGCSSITVVESMLMRLREAQMTPVLCVVSEEVRRALAPAAPLHDFVRFIVNDEPQRGQSSSFRLGIASLAEDEPFAVMLGDLPLISAQDMALLRVRFEHSRMSALLPCLTGEQESGRIGHLGHPQFFSAEWRGRFADGFACGQGGRGTIELHRSEIEFTDAPDGAFRDMDTEEDYRNICVYYR